MEGRNHQSGRDIAITAVQQLLPEVPPALIRKEVALLAAMQQRSGFGMQTIDQVLQIDSPGTHLARVALGAGQLADLVAAQEHHQPVWMQPHCNLAADQRGRHRVDEPPHLDHAGAPHPHREQCQATSAFGPLATRKLVHLMAC
jgi:hypothetical protein